MLLVKVDNFSNKICQPRSRRNIIVHETTAELKTLKRILNVNDQISKHQCRYIGYTEITS